MNAFDFFAAVNDKLEELDISLEEYNSRSVFVLKNKTICNPITSPNKPASSTCELCAGSGDFIDISEKRKHFLSHWHKNNVTRLHHNLPLLSNDQFQLLLKNDFHMGDELPAFLQANLVDDCSPKLITHGPWVTFLNTFALGQEKCALSRFPKLFCIHSTFFVPPITTLSINDTAKVVSLESPFIFILVYITAEEYLISAVKFQRNSLQQIYHEAKKTYSCRKKQGGSQLLRDKKGKVATSAGSLIRRENEMNLVRDALTSIKELRSKVTLKNVFRLYVSISHHLKEFINIERLFGNIKPFKFPSGLTCDKLDDACRFVNELISLKGVTDLN